MGGSRRRLKRDKPKVKVGVVKKKKTDKSKIPLELLEGRPSISKRLDVNVQWEEGKLLADNYQANKILLDPNVGFGRNRASEPLKSREEREAGGQETYSDDDELRAGCNLERKTGVAPPPRLTPRQRQVVEVLVKAHGEDVEAMVLDIKHNVMQHSAGQLKKLIAAYHHWRPEDKHDFRAPRKKPNKI